MSSNRASLCAGISVAVIALAMFMVTPTHVSAYFCGQSCFGDGDCSAYPGAFCENRQCQCGVSDPGWCPARCTDIGLQFADPNACGPGNGGVTVHHPLGPCRNAGSRPRYGGGILEYCNQCTPTPPPPTPTPTPPSTPPCTSPYTCSFTSATCSVATGTASDKDGAPVTVNIYDGASLIATGPANPAFSIALPLPIPPGPLKVTHTLAAYAVDRYPVGGVAGPSVSIYTNQNAVCLPVAPTTTLSAISPVAYNGTSVVTWSASKASSCTGVGGPAGWAGAHPNTGNFMTPPLLSNTTLSMYCTNDGGNGPAVSTTIVIGAPASPVISGVTQPDYCTSGPAANVSWSSVIQPQTAYQLQLSTDPTFSAPGAIKYDSGKTTQYVAEAPAPWYARLVEKIVSLFIARAATSSSASVPLGVMQYATTYYARVRVWDNVGTVTGWSAASNPIKTPTNAYPTVAMSVTPTKPLDQLPATFSDDTAYLGDPILVRTWDFGDGTVITENAPATNTIGHTYTNTASGLTAKMTVTTAGMLPGQSCSVTLPISVGKAIPKFEEVRP